MVEEFNTLKECMLFGKKKSYAEKFLASTGKVASKMGATMGGAILAVAAAAAEANHLAEQRRVAAKSAADKAASAGFSDELRNELIGRMSYLERRALSKELAS